MQNKFVLPPEIDLALSMIEKASFEAYIVGGCVRDFILGITPSDYDITTNAKPDEIIDIFSPFPVNQIGREFGTICVMINHMPIEITTYRVEAKYDDCRHPSSVSFAGQLSQDLSRRDFTINAMAYNHKTGIVDPYCGIMDIGKRVIRCVGEPDKRFFEDGLRILRAVRFCASLNFDLDESTYRSMQNLAGSLEKISKERIRCEFSAILMSKWPQKGLKILSEGLLFKYIIPEPALDNETVKIAAYAINSAPPDLIIRLSLLINTAFEKTNPNECRKVFTTRILKNLKYDNKTIKAASSIVAAMGYDYPPTQRAARRLLSDLNENALPLCDAMIYNTLAKENLCPFQNDYVALRALVANAIETGACVCLKQLAVSGQDLIDNDIATGKDISRTLNHLLDIVIDNPNYNNKEKLLEFALAYKKSAD